MGARAKGLYFSYTPRLVVSQWKAVRRRANQILLLKDGRLEDEGTRDDLLERSEEIRRLWHDDLSQEP